MDDKVSNLPDAILSRVLSSLSIREAVRTSLLSTRWKSVWASVPTLDLNNYEFKYQLMFLKFVDKVLLAKNGPVLEKVAIEWSWYDHRRTESWIRAAVEWNVKDLNLMIGMIRKIENPYYEVPQCLFHCKTLVVLKLSLNMYDNFPTVSACLPNLKVLHLIAMLYKDDNSARNLISSCPVLEELLISRVKYDNLQTLNVTSQSLKDLTLQFRGGKGLEEEYDAYEQEEEEEQELEQKLVVDAPALESLAIDDNVTFEYEAKDLFYVIKANIDISNRCPEFHDLDSYKRWSYQKSVFDLLRRISNVKFLTLSYETMQSLLQAYSENLPTFPNLTRLELFPHEESWQLVLEFLNNSPILEVLILQEFTFTTEEDQGTSSLWNVPNCLLSHLKRIKIKGQIWRGGPEKMEFSRKNGKVLEEMTVQALVYFQNESIEELLKLPRVSMTWSDPNLHVTLV